MKTSVLACYPDDADRGDGGPGAGRWNAGPRDLPGISIPARPIRLTLNVLSPAKCFGAKRRYDTVAVQCLPSQRQA